MTQLCRNNIKPVLADFTKLKSGEAHPGLLLTKGIVNFPEGSKVGEIKAGHIREICEIAPSAIYREAFTRWRSATKNFANTEASLVGRLYIGVTRDNALETGITVSHTYGMPMIPGSAVKGLCRAGADEWLKNEEASRYLFGNECGVSNEAELEIGGLIFHDAWWIPDAQTKPFVPEVITVHHQAYYGSEGQQAATDFDSPIPAPQIAVQGRFYFVIEGDPAWSKLAKRLLDKGLSERGIGAKRSSGYGFFVGD
ncbi:MAG: type III-B CRISPR module RAMP protein Cmr6 [Gallionella sp.]|nr:type III-B CRISPR module RAMP protein Cmr6 [Gallionella sp.]